MSYRLSKNIVATVAYYDVFQRPLTAFEIWKHLIAHDRDTSHESCRFSDILKALSSENIMSKLSEQNGMYVLNGRESLIQERIKAEKCSVAKMRRLKRLARLIAWVPYVRMVGATGSLAMKQAESGSDWDLFVVLRSGKIWIGRTLLTGFLHMIGKRRHGRKVNDRACLNYFVTDDNLRIETQDLFSSHEYRFLVPLINFKLFQIFELKNGWIREYRPNFFLTEIQSFWTLPESRVAGQFKMIMERLFDRFDLERWLSSWQKRKIEQNPNTSLQGSFIRADDRSLVFLPRPRGPQVFEKFKERLGV